MMNSISLTNVEPAVLPRTLVYEAPNEFSNGSVMFLTSLPINYKICTRENKIMLLKLSMLSLW